jgi:hypothetical protein
LGYCAYDYGSATATAPSGKGLIRGSTVPSTQATPEDSWVAVVVISAGPDGVINTTTFCPAAGTAASNVAAEGDDMVAARSYGEMISFGNAKIAAAMSALDAGGANNSKLCRLNDSGKMVCDIPNKLTNSNTPNLLCRVDSSGKFGCDTTYPGGNCPENERLTLSFFGSVPYFQCKPIGPNVGCSISKWNGSNFECVTAAGCPANYASKWNGSSFECVNLVYY